MTVQTTGPEPSWNPPAAAAPATTRRDRRRTGAEIWIVLGLSLGQSAVYALVSLWVKVYDALVTSTNLSEQTATLNASQSPRPYLDLTYQILGIAFALLPVVLALYLLSARGSGTLRRIGFDTTRPGRDTGWGFALAAAIGIPGLAFYALGRALGITVTIQASALDPYWWTVPVLVLSALRAGLLEEVIAVAYLRERTADLGWRRWTFIAASAVLRGSYHLYQGFGPFLGNVVMGVVFAWFYTSRWGRHRVLPLVVAHTILDVVSFVGFAYLPDAWLDALGVV